MVLGVLTVASPVAVIMVQTLPRSPSPTGSGIVFPWLVGRAFAHHAQLAAELDATRRELAGQALLAERRIARDVHDFVGHGLAAVMLQVTSARHVLRRDLEAAEDAALGRGGGPSKHAGASPHGGAPPQRRREAWRRLFRPSSRFPRWSIRHGPEVSRSSSMSKETSVLPGIGLAVYRIAQEALANAARHAPRAQPSSGLELTNGRIAFVAETTGPVTAAAASDRERPRYGLIGMQERATALGGQFAAGPTSDGWRVSCGFPRIESAVIRVALVDDQAIIRAGLARILSPADGFEVVAECADGRQAVQELPALTRTSS